MKDMHEAMLIGDMTESTAESIWTGTSVDHGLNGVLVAALTSTSPYATAAAYDVDSAVSLMRTSVENFETAVNGLSTATDLSELVSRVLSDEHMDADVVAYSDLLNEQLESVIYPQFEAGMRDINAVMSSAFAIGRANIAVSHTHEVAKHSSSLRLNAAGPLALQLIEMRLKYQQAVAHDTVEEFRIATVMKNEELERNVELAHLDSTWQLELFQYGGNLLAGISGGVGRSKGPSRQQSAMGGAMAGAAAGAQIGSAWPGYGTAIGGVVGGAAGAIGGYNL
jgi:hypothetical protein